MTTVAPHPPAPSTAAPAASPLNGPAMAAAQAAWAATPVRDRLAVLRRFRHLLAERPGAFTAALAHLPRSPGQSVALELLPLADACRFLETQAAKILRPVRLGKTAQGGRPFWLGRTTAIVEQAPLGRVLIIGPSNYPLFLVGVQVLQALTAGNAVVVKPGRAGGASAEALRDVLKQAGLPAHLVTVLPEDPQWVTAALESGIEKVFLTGSFTSGQRVLELLASRAIPAVMELSGCDAAVLLPSGDVHRYTQALRFGLCLNHSQTCIAPRLAFVPRAVLGQVERELAQALAGSAAHPIDAATYRRLTPLVNEALAQGARALIPASDTAMRFGPVVLTDVPPEAAITREDLFAPIVSLIPYNTADDLAALINGCPYALGASIFGPPQAAIELAARLKAGNITINDLIAPTADPRLPFAPPPGTRSGFGATRGPHGLLEMTTPKTRVVRRGNFLPHLDPPTPEDEKLFTHLLRASHGRSLAGRLAQLMSFLKTAARQKKSPRPSNASRSTATE